VFGEGLYAYYMLSCACGLLALASINGHALRYPFAHWPEAAGIAYTAGPALWAICKLQFGRRLLRLRHFAPPLDKLVQAFTLTLALAIPYAHWGSHPLLTFRLVQLSVVASTVVMVVGALAAMRRRYWPAVLYFFGVALLLAGVAAIVLPSWGWTTWAPNQMNVSQGALVAELVVFAVAMASRLRLVLRSEQALTARTQQLVEALGTDALTGATSRTGLESRGEEWLREGRPFALMLLDLDGFKGVNDAHGHAAGDAVLVATAQRLRQQLRADDVVARLGGDEFAVLVLGRPSRETLAAMAQRMVEACAMPVDFEGRPVTVGMSLGIACHLRISRGRTMPARRWPACCARPTARCTTPSSSAPARPSPSRTTWPARRRSGRCQNRFMSDTPRSDPAASPAPQPGPCTGPAGWPRCGHGALHGLRLVRGSLRPPPAEPGRPRCHARAQGLGAARA
jgi:diguanylate cyclase (GGDEF)-like protein